MVVGGPYETLLQIINEVESPNSVTVEVFRGSFPGGVNNGAPFPVQFDRGLQTAFQFFQLAPFEELTTSLSLADLSVQNGWVRVRSSTLGGKLSGNLIFRQKVGTRVRDSTGVASARRYRYAVIQADNRDEDSNTGVAFANADNSPITVTLDLFQADRKVGTASLQLRPREHLARLLTELFPAFGRQQGTLVIETDPGRSIPVLAVRLDQDQLTSIPVRPLGFVFQYEVRNQSNAVVETGFWMFDFEDFNLTGIGRRDSDAPGLYFGVRGSWLGNSFQFTFRRILQDGMPGIVVFNGVSAAAESTGGRRVSGRVTTVAASGQALSVDSFTAYHRFGAPPLN